MSTQATTAQQSNDAAQSQCARLLDSMLQGTDDILGAVVARVDGRAQACAFRHDSGLDPTRVAAVSSSLLALSESFGKETLAANTRYSSIVTDRGSIVTVRIPSSTRTRLLCVWADESENFATVLRFSLDAAARLVDVVEQED